MIASTPNKTAAELFLAASTETVDQSPFSGVYWGETMGMEEWNTR